MLRYVTNCLRMVLLYLPLSPSDPCKSARSCRALQYLTEHLLDSDSWLDKPEVLENFIAVDEGGDIRRHNKLTEQ